MGEPDRARLARYVRERREALGMTQEEVATSGGPSTATLRLIENASPSTPRLKSMRQLENALDWEPGSVRAILRGGEPAEKASAGGREASLESVARQIWAITDLPEGVRRGFIEFARGFLADDDEARRAG